MFYKNYTSISIYSTLVDVAKRAGRVGSGQLGRKSKRVIFKQVKRVVGQMSLTHFSMSTL